MRTVSFSNALVRKTLKDQFACTLINTVGDPSAGSSMGHAPNDQPGACARGIGKQNVQCLFVTPNLEVFHVASGFISPAELVDELKIAMQLFRNIQRSPSQAKQIVADAHFRRGKQLGFSDAQLRGGAQDLLFTEMSQAKNPQQVFALKTRRTVLGDQRFMVNHPLIAANTLLENPRLLVGNEKTAFVSSSNGSPSGGEIGN